MFNRLGIVLLFEIHHTALINCKLNWNSHTFHCHECFESLSEATNSTSSINGSKCFRKTSVVKFGFHALELSFYEVKWVVKKELADFAYKCAHQETDEVFML